VNVEAQNLVNKTVQQPRFENLMAAAGVVVEAFVLRKRDWAHP